LAELLGDVGGREVGPDDLRLDGAAGGVFAQDLAEVLGDAGVGV
jgi:hypothetical protein